MNVAPVYRAVLKDLSRACKTRPHFVQDVRFLLSLPLISRNDDHAVVAHAVAKPPSASLTVANDMHVEFSVLPEEPENLHINPRTTIQNYLQRPAASCYSIDTDALFALCYADLGSAVRQHPQPDSSVNPVAQQILRYRNLLWLKERLSRVLSDKTASHLATSLSITDGPGTDDFIPDEFFDTGSRSQLSGAPVTAAVRDDGTGLKSIASPHEASTVEQAKAEKASSTLSSSRSSSNGTVGQGTVTSVTAAEGGHDAISSAGAIGQQGEMFVLRHSEAFPMAAHFLSGFATVPAAELASCAHLQAALLRLVREKFPKTVTCQDERVRLNVVVEPFDAQYITREHAGAGYFAAAHRQFRVQFSMQPLVLGVEGAGEKTEVLVVNSYFVRLDMEVMQLVEEVGYLHSRDVLRMLRERDYGDHFSDYMSNAVTDTLGEGEEGTAGEASSSCSDCRGDNGSSAKTQRSEHISGNAATTAVSSCKNARVFSLYFVNPTDAPMVLKGLLYYKIGKRSELASASIRCIAFGSLLLEA
ncbi:hypothetical protein ABL78_0625 [Leptomonas seymouri]|uniref:Uncharacterized protein n=1 Tax=Leptomonas seymouri TaxID=5684 RepID=A0A0N1IBR0_LEPSE|nr:hypothetical protein ABL78_0625 [Leptomonas seymouri]|eukprot:KPI90243.1 hypothetical protein ABL78_0625 [Leptomonas seymouri]